MKLNAVGVTAKDIPISLQFYTLLGFHFSEYKPEETHIESTIKDGETKLMIDSEAIIQDILGSNPIPANHSAFALQYESAQELDRTVEKIKAHGFTIVKEPWDAFWGQRYAIVQDPSGYMVDLYAAL